MRTDAPIIIGVLSAPRGVVGEAEAGQSRRPVANWRACSPRQAPVPVGDGIGRKGENAMAGANRLADDLMRQVLQVTGQFAVQNRGATDALQMMEVMVTGVLAAGAHLIASRAAMAQEATTGVQEWLNRIQLEGRTEEERERRRMDTERILEGLLRAARSEAP